MKFFKRTKKYLYNWQVYRANWFPCFTILAKQLLQFWGLLLRCHVRPLLDIDIGYWYWILDIDIESWIFCFNVILLIKWLTGPQKTRGFLWRVTISTWAPTAKGKTCHQTKRSSSGRRNVENAAGTEHTWRFCSKHKQKNCNTCSGCELGRKVRGHRAAGEDDQFEEQPPHYLLSLQFRWFGGRCWVWFQLFLCILLTSVKEISKLSTFFEGLV